MTNTHNDAIPRTAAEQIAALSPEQIAGQDFAAMLSAAINTVSDRDLDFGGGDGNAYLPIAPSLIHQLDHVLGMVADGHLRLELRDAYGRVVRIDVQGSDH